MSRLLAPGLLGVISTVAMVGASAASAATRSDDFPTLVTAPIDKVFEPYGFDDNDDAEVVLHGSFANTCYKVGPAAAEVDVENLTITIHAQSWQYNDDKCAQLVVPFIQSVKLGVLPAGHYTIAVVDRPEASTVLFPIVPATTRSPDDFLYAPVDNVGVSTDATGARRIYVEGSYPYMFVGCMKIVEVREQVTPGNVIVVQPIARMFTDAIDCLDQAQSKKFRLEQPLTDATAPAEYLAHVRSLGGQAVNRLFDLTR